MCKYTYVYVCVYIYTHPHPRSCNLHIQGYTHTHTCNPKPCVRVLRTLSGGAMIVSTKAFAQGTLCLRMLKDETNNRRYSYSQPHNSSRSKYAWVYAYKWPHHPATELGCQHQQLMLVCVSCRWNLSAPAAQEKNASKRAKKTPTKRCSSKTQQYHTRLLSESLEQAVAPTRQQ